MFCPVNDKINPNFLKFADLYVLKIVDFQNLDKSKVVEEKVLQSIRTESR